mmetsp:Transcript_22262/g.84433  ORF Transcript_22262/g.84433 Transcript_22262/m.84433 type:complete len:342 (+) Transcript_22262:489-1514(+)
MARGSGPRAPGSSLASASWAAATNAAFGADVVLVAIDGVHAVASGFASSAWRSCAFSADASALIASPQRGGFPCGPAAHSPAASQGMERRGVSPEATRPGVVVPRNSAFGATSATAAKTPAAEAGGSAGQRGTSVSDSSAADDAAESGTAGEAVPRIPVAVALQSAPAGVAAAPAASVMGPACVCTAVPFASAAAARGPHTCCSPAGQLSVAGAGAVPAPSDAPADAAAGTLASPTALGACSGNTGVGALACKAAPKAVNAKSHASPGTAAVSCWPSCVPAARAAAADMSASMRRSEAAGTSPSGGSASKTPMTSPGRRRRSAYPRRVPQCTRAPLTSRKP